MTTNIKPENKTLFNRDAWATPQYLFDWLNSIYNFNVDLCASKENAKCEAYFNQDDNSLIQGWRNHQGIIRNTGFCNPPYSKIKPWVEKAVYEANNGFTTAMLIPTPNGESYYKDIFDNAKSITFITGRVAFFNPHENKCIAGNTRGSCVVEFSKSYKRTSPEIYHVLRDDLINGFS